MHACREVKDTNIDWKAHTHLLQFPSSFWMLPQIRTQWTGGRPVLAWPQFSSELPPQDAPLLLPPARRSACVCACVCVCVCVVSLDVDHNSHVSSEVWPINCYWPIIHNLMTEVLNHQETFHRTLRCTTQQLPMQHSLLWRGPVQIAGSGCRIGPVYRRGMVSSWRHHLLMQPQCACH